MVVPFAKFVFICALSTLLQEAWLNGESLLEAFDTLIDSLPQTIVAGKTAEFIFTGGFDMIKYLTDHLAVLNQPAAENKKQSNAKVPSEWVN